MRGKMFSKKPSLTLFVCQRILQQKGYIYKASYEGWYSVSDEAYYPESQVQDATDQHGQTIKVCIVDACMNWF